MLQPVALPTPQCRNGPGQFVFWLMCSAAVNMRGQISQHCDFISFGSISSNGIAESNDSSIFSFSSNLHASHTGCADLYSVSKLASPICFCIISAVHGLC